MKSLPLLLFLVTTPSLVHAMTCTELVATTQLNVQANIQKAEQNHSGFSPVQHLLGRKRVKLLGRRFDSSSQGGGGSSRSSTHDEGPRISTGISELSPRQISIDISRLLEIIDPLPGGGSSVPFQRKISTRVQNKDAIDYIYTDKYGPVKISAGVFKLMAEIVAESRSAAHQQKLISELSDDFIQKWFLRAIAGVRERYVRDLELREDYLIRGYYWHLSDVLKKAYIDDPVAYSKYSKMLAEEPVRVVGKAKSIVQLEQVVKTLRLMVGRRSADLAYDTFVKMVLALHADPTLTHLTEITDDRQTQTPIDPKKLTRIFRLANIVYEVLGETVFSNLLERGEHLENFNVWIADGSKILDDFQAYAEAKKLGHPTRKNEAILIAILLLKVKEQMIAQDFESLMYAVKLSHDNRDITKIVRLFPDVESEYGVSIFETFKIIREAMEFYPSFWLYF